MTTSTKATYVRATETYSDGFFNAIDLFPPDFFDGCSKDCINGFVEGLHKVARKISRDFSLPRDPIGCCLKGTVEVLDDAPRFFTESAP